MSSMRRSHQYKTVTDSPRSKLTLKWQQTLATRNPLYYKIWRNTITKKQTEKRTRSPKVSKPLRLVLIFRIKSTPHRLHKLILKKKQKNSPTVTDITLSIIAADVRTINMTCPNIYSR